MPRFDVGCAAALLLVTAGCDRGASGQSVAVVNGEEISLSELNAELAAANVPANADRKTVMPQVLQRMVERRLFAQQAREEGVDRSPEFLTQERRMREELMINLYGRRQMEAVKAPTQPEIDRFIAQNPATFRNRTRYQLEQVVFDRPADESVLADMQDDHSLAEVEQTLRALGIQSSRATSVMDSATVPPTVLQVIEPLPPGEPFVIPVGNRMVASVITARQPVAITGEQSRQVAAELIRRRQVQQGVEKQLAQLKSSGKVEYQPGYAPKQAAAPAAAAAGKAPAR